MPIIFVALRVLVSGLGLLCLWGMFGRTTNPKPLGVWIALIAALIVLVLAVAGIESLANPPGLSDSY
jgi:hypothetical protein